jgi:hypothetical protein
LDFATTFESLDPFVNFGSVNQLWPGFQAEATGTGVANRGGILIDGESGGLPFATANDLLVQFSFNIDFGTDDFVQLRMGPYSSGAPTAKAGMGVHIEDDEMVFFVGNADGSSVDELAPISINALQSYIVRLFHNAVSGKIECYVDGTNVGDLEWPGSDYSDYANVMMFAWTTGGGSPVLNLKSLYMSVQP